VAGAVSLQTDEPITTDLSSTEGGVTQLVYNSDDPIVFVTIQISAGTPFFVDVTTNDTFSASAQDCDVTYLRADDEGIGVNFDCVVDEFHWFGADAEPTGEVTITGTATATR
jgi:hypothetical protein